ncbi:TadE family type IV pilus minor pilin [Nocardioides stalactiti]|uniref:TadE family type IV pilus minor pilin n=1 Tax=Nocardioides stalactiti TaxID=2755356 RepID=UPI0028A6810A|nr:TadE family type IV pilus minor pilin [Nocardioides stalactiti]
MTAELALGLPILLAVTSGMVWLLSVGAAQVRTVDAAREAARAAARGDEVAVAGAVGERVAPDGVRVEVAHEAGRVTARAAGHVPGPGGLFDFLPGADVRAEAVAVVEEDG